MEYTADRFFRPTYSYEVHLVKIEGSTAKKFFQVAKDHKIMTSLGIFGLCEVLVAIKRAKRQHIPVSVRPNQ